MLLVNKNIGVQIFTVTVSENNPSPEAVFEMYLHSDYTKQSYSIPLGVNLSTHTSRYDRFQVDTTEFESIPEGVYRYSIMDQSTTVFERGVLKVFTPSADQPNSITPADADDDFIVYQS